MLMPTLVALVLLGRLDALWIMPAEFVSVRALLPTIGADEVIVGSLGGVMGGLIVVAIRARRGHRPRLLDLG